MKTFIPLPKFQNLSANHHSSAAVNALAGLALIRRRGFLACFLALALTGMGRLSAHASDPVGIYALVNKVVLEPNDTAPERIQILGAFAIAEGSGDKYKTAERGYLYFKINPEKAQLCRNEWMDLKAVAGTGQIVSFASRYQQKGTLHQPRSKPQDPDVYPLAFGLHKVRPESDYPPIKQLLKFHGQRQERNTSP